MYEDNWKTERKLALCTRVSPYVDKSVRKLAKGMGITISEYLRRLIMQDLDSKRLFNNDLRRTVDSYDDEDVRPRRVTEEFTIHNLRKNVERLKRQSRSRHLREVNE